MGVVALCSYVPGRGKGPPWPPGTGMLSSPLRSPRGSWQMLVRWTPKREPPKLTCTDAVPLIGDTCHLSHACRHLGALTGT